ncbi:macrophage mannose receptor 1-like [Antennarius striatus]|uniref:macrophage mannose receptor 1-like n=1 Tax=Antennarius striatus TaxID=241820 RepID=UPI0035B401AF
MTYASGSDQCSTDDNGRAWIGLHLDLINGWRWSLNDFNFYGPGEADFRNWFSGQLESPVEPSCVGLFSDSPHNGTWLGSRCYIRRPFVCYNGDIDGAASFVKVDIPLPWSNALTFCRENHVDLASIRNRQENEIIADLSAGDIVWIGLHGGRVWSDGSSSPFRQWASGEPNSITNRCVAARESGLWSDEDCCRSFPFICYAENIFEAASQNETSITLQWNTVNDNVSFILQFNDSETNITAPDGDGPVTHTVPGLNPGTQYTFILFSVFEKTISSGIKISAVTAPTNTDGFRSIGRDETSITLLWNTVNDNVDFILQFNGSEINITAPDGDGPVTQTVSNLTAGTKYTFILFSVFENVRSSGINITAVTVRPPPARTRQYFFVNEPRNWTQAQSFCRMKFSDLATITNTDEGAAIASLTADLDGSGDFYYFSGSADGDDEMTDASGSGLNEGSGDDTGRAWIGLHLDLINGWRWSLNNVTFYDPGEADFRNWFSGQLESPVEPSCVGLFSDSPHNGTWLGSRCYFRRPFVCYNGDRDGAASFVKVDIPLPWSNALAFCRENHVDLASIRNQQENEIIANLSAGDTVWIGLHGGRVWSDGSSSPFRQWASGEPNSITNRCVAARESGLWSDEDCCRSFPFICYAENSFEAIAQNETSITLQWNTVNDNVDFIIQFNGSKINITAPDGDGPVTHTVSDLTAGTQYTFILFSVFEKSRSSGIKISAVTAPQNTDGFRSIGRDETSITLLWNTVNDNVDFILQFNGSKINITAPDGDGPVTHKVSNLTGGTQYIFTLFSVFENVRSSGINITAVTAPLPPTRTRQYFFVNEPRNWTQAQSFCRMEYSDLATITNTDEGAAIAILTADLDGSGYYYFWSTDDDDNMTDASGSGLSEGSGDDTDRAWIGLHLDLINGWRWSLNNVTFYGPGEADFRNWFSGQLESPVEPSCVGLFSDSPHNGTWLGSRCYIRRPFVCYNGDRDGVASFVKVDIPLPWSNALTFCRENHVDLASIRNRQENEIIANLSAGDTVWIGLHGGRVWSDGSSSPFRQWASGEPNSITNRCVAARESGLWSDEDCCRSFPFICYAENSFEAIAQNETSITLQWNTVNDNVDFIIQFNGSKINITAPDGDGPVTHTVSDLTAGIQHTFILFSVFGKSRSSGIQISAVTAPLNTDGFRSIGRDETSITLLWNTVNDNVDFILQFNGSEINITAPDGDGPVTHTVSNLTAGTQYTFTLFSVFENVRSSGIKITAVTAPLPPGRLRRYFFVNEPRNWTQAQSFCRMEYSDLATITNTDEGAAIASLTADLDGSGDYYCSGIDDDDDNMTDNSEDILFSGSGDDDDIHTTGRAWIGLHLDLINGWRWSLNNVTFYGPGEADFRNWFSGQLESPVEPSCVGLFSDSPHNGTWLGSRCYIRRPFVCYNGDIDGAPSFVKVDIPLPWNNAQTFCRENHVDLASIRNQQENEIIANLSAGDTVWIGLHGGRVWSDGNSSLFRQWASGEPNSITNRCVAAGQSGLWSDESCCLSFPFICYTKIPPNTDNFEAITQNETSITLQWNTVNDNVDFILQFNGSEINITAPDGDGLVTHTVSNLTAGAQYTFILFSVFKSVRSSGINITAVTAPPNPENFISNERNATSVTLQWNTVNSIVNFILQFNGSEININAPDGDGPVTHTVSDLTAGTQYTFTVFSVFENVRSSGVSITVVTGELITFINLYLSRFRTVLDT